jgi:hypothetical protein
MKTALALALLGLSGSACAFMPVAAPAGARTLARSPAATRPAHVRAAMPLLASSGSVEAEAEALEALAQQCLDDGCSVDMVDDLKKRLRDERSVLIGHLQAVDSLLSRFEKATEVSGQRDETVVEQLVKAIFQIFRTQTAEERYKISSEYVMAGFSGDIPKKGMKDAWDYDLALAGKPPVPPGAYKADDSK